MLDLESQYLLFRHASPTEIHRDGESLFEVGDLGEEALFPRTPTS